MSRKRSSGREPRGALRTRAKEGDKVLETVSRNLISSIVKEKRTDLWYVAAVAVSEVMRVDLTCRHAWVP